MSAVESWYCTTVSGAEYYLEAYGYVVRLDTQDLYLRWKLVDRTDAETLRDITGQRGSQTPEIGKAIYCYDRDSWWLSTNIVKIEEAK